MFKPFASSVGKRICSNRTRLFLAAGTAILAAIAFMLASVAANDAILPRSNRAQASRPASTPSQANKTYTLYSGLWRTDGSFVSTIRIKNVLIVAPMDVTPVLFMADGTPYMLSSVHVAVSGVATVNINDALAAAPPSIASRISQFGSAALIYSYPSPGHVTAQMAAIDAARSLSYTYSFIEPMNMPGHHSKQVLEGLWWKHDRGVRGFIGVSNSTDEPQTVNLRSIGTREVREDSEWREIELAAHSTRLLQLDEELGTQAEEGGNRAGGIRVEYQGSRGAILVTGGLANESEGYSANMPFWFHDMSSSASRQVTYASAGLMLGKPDPMMMPGFPKETTFSVYLSLRNTTEKPLDVALQLNYMSGMGMEGSAPVTRNLPAQPLAPFEAKQVDLQGPLNAAGLKNFSGSINLSTSFTGQAGDLLLATGSVDQTGTYVFEVEPQGIGSSRSKYTNYWGVTNGNDTMFTLWNPTNAPQDILATFYYGNGSGKYNLPVHLGPQASTTIDMAMLIAEIKPDADGNVIPPSIQEGSAVFANSKGTKEQITLVIVGGIYNVTTATCGGICVYCCGDGVAIFPNPIFCPIGETMPCYARGTDCYGSVGNYTGTWSSSNTSVMTVDNNGNVTGHAVGTATITWISSFFLVDYTGQYCYSDSGTCPSNQPQTSAPANTTPRIDSITPAQGLIGTTVSVTISGSGFGQNPIVGTVQGITANVTSHSDAQVVANFVISPTSPVTGNSNVTVDNQEASINSNGVNFYIQIPASLTFISVGVLPDGTTGAFGCPSNTSGIRVDIKYQVMDQNSPPGTIASASMTPHEKGTLFSGAAYDNNVGPVPNYPTSGQTTAVDGSFHDVPLGACATSTFSSLTATQNLTMLLGTASYPVRSQSWTVTGPTIGHGTIRNAITSPGTGSDVSASR